MRRRCCCCSSNEKFDKLSFFRFPMDEERCQQWLNNCGKPDLFKKTPAKLYSGYRICSRHFEKVMFAGMAEGKLKRTAVPTIFENMSPPSHTIQSTSTESAVPGQSRSSPICFKEEPSSPVLDITYVPIKTEQPEYTTAEIFQNNEDGDSKIVNQEKNDLDDVDLKPIKKELHLDTDDIDTSLVNNDNNTCQFCLKHFTNPSELKLHEMLHQKEYLVNGITSISSSDITDGYKIENTSMKEEISDSECKELTDVSMETVVAKNEQRPARPWICSYCNNNFRRKHELDAHLLGSHKKQIKDIRQEISSKIHQCKQCDYKTTRNGDFNRHILKHTGVTLFKCQFCRKGFNRRLYLDDHLLKEHKKSCENIKKSIVSKIHNCSVCEFETVRFDDYQRHLACHKETSKTLTKIKCDKCEFSSYDQQSVKQHLRIHCNEKRLQCSFCERGFNKTHHFYSHLLTNHKHQIDNINDVIKHKIHKCSKCEYETLNLGQFRRHLASHGDITDLETFQCEQCGYSTNRKEALIKHMRVHSSVKKYSCPECDKGFNFKNCYDAHVLSMHGHNAELMSTITLTYYECNKCSYKNIKPTLLETHMKNKHPVQ